MHTHDSICNCGTEEEALAVARSFFVKTAGADCMVWALQVSTIMRTLALEAILALSLILLVCRRSPESS